jgi:hypothetical protein
MWEQSSGATRAVAVVRSVADEHGTPLICKALDMIDVERVEERATHPWSFDDLRETCGQAAKPMTNRCTLRDSNDTASLGPSLSQPLTDFGKHWEVPISSRLEVLCEPTTPPRIQVAYVWGTVLQQRVSLPLMLTGQVTRWSEACGIPKIDLAARPTQEY